MTTRSAGFLAERLLRFALVASRHVRGLASLCGRINDGVKVAVVYSGARWSGAE